MDSIRSRIRSRAFALAALALAQSPIARADFTAVDDIGGTYDKLLTVAPVVVCDDDGTNCGDLAAMFKHFAIRTYAQAGIALAVLPARVFNSTDGNDVADIFGVSKIDPGRSSNRNTIDAWFVRNITGAYGSGVHGGAGVAVNTPSVMNETPLREDTFSHEVGHNLGLRHTTLGAMSPDNMMSAGNLRNAPTSTLTQAQIDLIRTSNLLTETPEVLLAHSTNTDGSSTVFNVKFASLPDGIDLRRLSIDLPDLHLVNPRPVDDLRPYEYLLDLRTDFFMPLNGQLIGDTQVQLPGMEFEGPAVSGPSSSSPESGLPFSVSYGENTSVYFGSTNAAYVPYEQSISTGDAPEIVFDFGTAGSLFHTGDEFNFSINLLEHHVHEEVAYAYSFDRDVTGSIVQFDFGIGLSVLTELAEADAISSSRHITAIADYDPSLGVKPYGPQYLPGEVRPTDLPFEVEYVAPVPLPGGLTLAMSGLLAIGAVRRRHRGLRVA